MKKHNWMIWIGVLLVILVGIAISLWLINKNSSPKLEENKGELYLNSSYQWNMIINTDDIDDDIEGTYSIEDNKLFYEMEDKKRIAYTNIYKEFYDLLSISSLENKDYNIQIPANQLRKSLTFTQIPVTIGEYNCMYQVENFAIYSVECNQLTNHIIIDFDFE